ncbi:MAG: cupin domain-containing protein [Pseudomonadales bacterium]
MPDVNADFGQAACLAPEEFRWVPSPQPEVVRVMLDRVGDEVAVATSLVRYAPGSRFPAHEHALGEEYLVLEGEFGDEHGRYLPGTYVRNPPGSRHTPFSDPGCVIWVKLRQFYPEDQRQMVEAIDLPVPARASTVRELHRFRDEAVSVAAAQTDAVLVFPACGQIQELFVIYGAVRWADRTLGARGWLRVPAGEPIRVTALEPTRLLHKIRPAIAVPGGATDATSAASAET